MRTKEEGEINCNKQQDMETNMARVLKTNEPGQMKTTSKTRKKLADKSKTIKEYSFLFRKRRKYPSSK